MLILEKLQQTRTSPPVDRRNQIQTGRCKCIQFLNVGLFKQYFIRSMHGISVAFAHYRCS